MTRLMDETVTLNAQRDAIWQIVNDADALRRVLPGCESLERLDEGLYQAVMATRLQFLTLRMSGTCEVQAQVPGERFRLSISGRPLGLVGTVAVDVPVVMSDDGDGTRVDYQIDLTMTGRLAAFGAPIVRSTVKSQISELVRNVEREAAGR